MTHTQDSLDSAPESGYRLNISDACDRCFKGSGAETVTAAANTQSGLSQRIGQTSRLLRGCDRRQRHSTPDAQQAPSRPSQAPDRPLKSGIRALVLACLSSVVAAVPALAAERVAMSYGPLEISVSVEVLTTYAKEGKLDGNLSIYAQFVDPQELDQLRNMLRDRIELSPVTVSQFLYSSFGETSLHYLGELIETDNRQNGFYALRAAVILAASDPDGLTLLNVIKQFPSSTVRIQSGRALRVANEFTQLFHQTDRVTSLIEQQAATEASAYPVEVVPPVDLQQSGSSVWQQETLMLEDRQRRRKFGVDLYLPAIQSSVPVLVISHGLAADRGDFSELAQYLVSYGFAVAVLDHPGSDRQQWQNLSRGLTQEVTEPNEFIDRPLDVSYLLDELERLNRASPLQGRFNLQQVGVIGHSLGGYTALALAGAELNFDRLQQECRPDRINLNSANFSMLIQCQALQSRRPTGRPLRDERVRAVVAVNPVSNSIFGQEGLQHIQVPVMLIGGSNDTITPVLLEQVCPFTWLTVSDKYLVFIEKGTHTYTSQAANSLLLPTATANPNPALAQHYLQALSLAFVKVYVAAQPEYRDYLRSSYTRSISQSPLPLSLLNTLASSRLSQTLGTTCPGAYAPAR